MPDLTKEILDSVTSCDELLIILVEPSNKWKGKTIPRKVRERMWMTLATAVTFLDGEEEISYQQTVLQIFPHLRKKVDEKNQGEGFGDN